MIKAVVEVQDTIKNLATKDELKVVASYFKIIKSAITDTNKQVHNHEIRITNLERLEYIVPA